MNKNIKRGLALVSAVTLSGAATAADAAGGPDMSGLTGAVNFGTVTIAILAIAGSLAVVYVAIKGATLGLSMLRR